MKDYLVENLRGMCAFPTPYGRCDQSRELRDFCTSCLAATEIERLRALASASSSPPSESVRVQHARMQGAADGFQQGWHGVLKRLADGDDLGELQKLVPTCVAKEPAFTPDEIGLILSTLYTEGEFPLTLADRVAAMLYPPTIVQPASSSQQQESVTTFTPLLWASMDEEQRYAEYIRVRGALISDVSNHHNALACPYCNPDNLTLPASSSPQPNGEQTVESIMGRCLCGLQATTSIPMWRGMTLAVCERCKADSALPASLEPKEVKS